MPGQDQSQNLGGMLNNIAGTVGTMADPMKKALDSAMRPRGDMNDPAFLQRMSQWESDRGNATAAAQYLTQSREAQRRIDASVKQGVERGRAHFSTRYAQVARNPNATAQEKQKAYDEAMEYGAAHGLDMTQQLGAIDQQAHLVEQRAFEQEQMETKQAEERASNWMASQFTSNMDADQLHGMVDRTIQAQAAAFMKQGMSAPEAEEKANGLRDVLQVRAEREVTLREKQQERRNAEGELKMDVADTQATDAIESLSDRETAAQFQTQLNAYNEMKEKYFRNGQWATPIARRNYEENVEKLANQVWNLRTQELSSEASSRRAYNAEYRRALVKAQEDRVTNADIKAYAEHSAEANDYVPFNELSSDEIRAAVRADRVAAVQRAYGVEPGQAGDESEQAGAQAGTSNSPAAEYYKSIQSQ